VTIQQDLSLHEQIGTLRDRLESGDIEGGRALLSRLLEQFPDSSEAQFYARMLARPTAIAPPGEPERRRDRERDWLRAHAREYPGCWLAVSGDALVAADPNYAEVIAAVRRTVGVDSVVLYFQP
jgi:hypothetical protein